jgi:hypothetical protein
MKADACHGFAQADRRFTLTKGMERTGFQASIEKPLLVDGNIVPKDADV